MTSSQIKVPSMSIKSLVGRHVTKKTNFAGSEVEIRKLTIAEVNEMRKQITANRDSEEGGLAMMRFVIRTSATGGSDLTDEDFNSFALGDLQELLEEIMVFSGVSARLKGNDTVDNQGK